MARFVLLPQDDLNLACLLKSPLIGLDEDAALHPRLEAHRPSVARAARAARASRTSPRRTSAWPTGWRAPTTTTPFDFFAARARPRGRPRAPAGTAGPRGRPIRSTSCWPARCSTSGVEAGSLQGFLRWFEAGGGEIKRDLDAEPPARGAHPDRACARRACRRRSSTCPTRRACRATPSGCWPPPTARRASGCRAPTMPTKPRAPGAPRCATARWRSRTACSTSP